MLGSCDLLPSSFIERALNELMVDELKRQYWAFTVGSTFAGTFGAVKLQFLNSIHVILSFFEKSYPLTSMGLKGRLGNQSV